MSKTILRALCFMIVALSAMQQTARAQSAPPALSVQEADTLFAAQKWNEAAVAYQALTKSDPNNGRLYFRLGYSLHSAGKYDQAVPAFRRSVEIGNNPLVMYNLACSYARLGDKDNAFEWLNKSINAGFLAPQMSSDPDLATLHDDARFKEATTTAAKIAKPCEFQPEYRQFDFWVGDWDVQNTQGQRVGTNTIQRIEDGCIVLENWTGLQGGTGKSINFYNAGSGKWRQTWVSSTGGVTEYQGSFKDGAMRYEGETYQRNGTKLMVRLTFFNLAPDRVRQLAEQSTDGGKTWSVQYDFIYIRRKS